MANKTVCDKCGAEVKVNPAQRFLRENAKGSPIDLCDNHASDFESYFQSGRSFIELLNNATRAESSRAEAERWSQKLSEERNLLHGELTAVCVEKTRLGEQLEAVTRERDSLARELEAVLLLANMRDELIAQANSELGELKKTLSESVELVEKLEREKAELLERFEALPSFPEPEAEQSEEPASEPSEPTEETE